TMRTASNSGSPSSAFEARQRLVVRLPGRAGFTLVELLVVIAMIGLLAALLLPALSGGKSQGPRITCLSNLRQVATASLLYMADNNGGLFHHHEGWVLDDGSQVDSLPATPARW